MDVQAPQWPLVFEATTRTEINVASTNLGCNLGSLGAVRKP